MAWLYIAAVIIAAVIVVTAGPFTMVDWSQVIALGLLLVACETSATLVSPRGLAWSALMPRRVGNELRQAP